MLIVIDDFHWADSVSTELVECLVRWPLGARVLIAIGQRPRQASPRLLGALTNGVELGAVRRVELGPLDIAQAARLLDVPEHDPGLRDLHSHSSGVPLYLLALRDGEIRSSRYAPGEVEVRPADWFTAVVEGELQGRTEREYRLAAATALLGDYCDLEMLLAVADVDPDTASADVGSLLRHDILRRTDAAHGLGLRHPLLRVPLQNGVDVGWQREAHRRAALMLARRRASATERARHLERSGVRPDDADLQTLADAADECRPCAPDLAVHWLELALRAFPEDGSATTPAQADMLLRLAHALAAAHRLPASRERLAEALRVIPAEDRRRRAMAGQMLCIVECLMGHHREAPALIDAVLASAGGASSAQAVDLVVSRSLIACLEGRTPDREEIACAIRRAREGGDHLAEASLLAIAVLADLCPERCSPLDGRLDASAALFDRMTDAEIARHPEHLAILAWAETLVGRFAEASRHFNRNALIARAHGDHHILPVLLLGQANAYRHLGRIRDARRLVREVREHATAMSLRWLDGLATALSSQLAVMGTKVDRAEAVPLAERALSELATASPHVRFAGIIALATAVRQAGENHRCVTLLIDAGGGPELPRIPEIVRPMCFELIASATADMGGRPDIWVERAEACAPTRALTHHEAYTLGIRAHVQRAAGDFSSATRTYADSAELFSKVGMACAEASALVSAARCALQAGSWADAPAYLALARELAGRTGAMRIREEAQAVRAELEARTIERKPEPDELSVLTGREREIAEIAGLGMKTRDIATQLRLSPRTVDVHLTRIYRKLNISSRAALARLMAHRPPTVRADDQADGPSSGSGVSPKISASSS
jgi:DNA-binding CsgD family transcriptional regulator